MSQLQKARLFSVDSSQLDFEFLFNPDALSFKHAVKVKDAEGARTAQGTPKVAFEYPQAMVLTLNKIMFDTFEEGTSVLEKYINKLKKAVEFAGFAVGGVTSLDKRPPIYMFVWGSQNYLRCFVEKLDYKLTLFLTDGTPVRAEVNLSLKEVDKSYGQANERTYDLAKFGDRDDREQPPEPYFPNDNWQEEQQKFQQECDQLTSQAAAKEEQAKQKRQEAEYARKDEKGHSPDNATANQADAEAAQLEDEAKALREQASPACEKAEKIKNFYN
jgi:Contractile injection system tube protein